MVMEELRTQFYVYNGGGYTKPSNAQKTDNSDESIFTQASSEELKNKLEEVENKQGFIGKIWNGFKNLTGLGLSSKDAKKAIEDFKKGKISYEEAEATIQKFDSKQKGIVDIVANVAAGVTVAAVAVGTCGAGLAAGAAVGGAVKAGLKTVDRATNDVKGDALDVKQIAKDGITGAVSGAVTVATAGFGAGAAAAKEGAKAGVKEMVKQGAIQGAKRGAITGAAAGAASYTTDAMFEKDVHFNVSDLMKNTLENTVAGAITGGTMGATSGATSGLRINELVRISDNAKLNDSDIKLLDIIKNARSDAKRAVFKNKVKEALENSVFA